MAQTLTDILGANATATGTTVTIDLADFKFKDGTQMLDSPSTATDSQKIATIISGIFTNSKPEVDTDGNDIEDKTNVVVSEDSFSPKSFVTREDEQQIQNQFIFNIYTVDSTSYDPDNAI